MWRRKYTGRWPRSTARPVPVAQPAKKFKPKLIPLSDLDRAYIKLAIQEMNTGPARSEPVILEGENMGDFAEQIDIGKAMSMLHAIANASDTQQQQASPSPQPEPTPLIHARRIDLQ